MLNQHYSKENITINTINMKEKLAQLQNEVETFYKFLEEKLGHKVFYTIFFSKVSYNSDILFIGINPGSIEEYMTSGLEKFEYVEHTYTLASETKKVFELAGYPNLLEKLDDENKVVKINLYFIPTIGTKELNEFMSELEKFDLKNEFLSKSQDWTSRLIELTNPKLIIFEGKTAFDESPPFTSNLKLIEQKGNENVFLYRYEELPYSMIGYKRHFSNIQDKTLLAEILKLELNRIYKS
jgi:hypothetical protein